MTQHILEPLFGPPPSPVERGTRAGHLQFIEEQVNHALLAWGVGSARGHIDHALRAHLAAILGAVRKLQEIA